MSQRIPQKPKRRRPDFRQGPCQDVFTCRVCGWPVGPQAAGTSTGIIAPTASPVSIWMTSPATGPPTAAASWSR